MRLSPLRRHRAEKMPGISGVVRLDRRTKNLTRRLRPGEIAVIHHLDIDRASAEALVACRVGAVVNAAESVSGRYPNLGPEIIASAGIPLIDAPGADIFAALREGERVRVEGATVRRADAVVADGELLDRVRVEELMERARTGLTTQLEAFTLNTVEYLRREQDLLLDGVGVPKIRTELENLPVVVVVRGYDYRAELRMLRGFIREHRPVLVGVDAGAEALVEAGYTPDLIVGDLDPVSADTLRSGAEIVVLTDRGADRDVHSPGLQRLERLGVDAVTMSSTCTSEDVAMLLADSKQASLIVAVGGHATLVQFLDKGQSTMASTFVTRLRVGPRLVDAKSVGMLYQDRIRSWQLLALVVAGLFAVLVAVAATPAGEQWLGLLEGPWGQLVDRVRDGLS